MATKCRHRKVRRRAIELLAMIVRKEGVWSSVVAARVAQRLMLIDLAEDGDVPNWKRVAGVDVKPRKVILKYIPKAEDLDVVVMEELIEWQ